MSQQLSLRAAIAININIMLGTGIFINIGELAKRAGLLGAASYLIMGVLLFPLIWSIANLLVIYPGGNFYIFGAQSINPFAGFLSAWSYFTGKLATAILAIHIGVLLIQQLLPTIFPGNPIIYDVIIVALFIFLNMFHLHIGSNIQGFFLMMKGIPVIFVFLSALYLLKGAPVPSMQFLWTGIPATLPLVLYAALGFEAACSLSSRIKDPHKNAPLAIFVSYTIVIFIACLYQLFFYTSLGDQLGLIQNFKQGLPLLLQKLSIPQTVMNALLIVLNLGIASSALGGSYGVFFSNSWNLYAIAERKHIFFSDWFSKQNRYDIPWLCVCMEGVVCLMYLAITRARQVPLQQIAALGCTIAYTISVLSLLSIPHRRGLIGYLGLVNCFILLSACLYGFVLQGIQALFFFGIILALGIGMFVLTSKSKPLEG